MGVVGSTADQTSRRTTVETTRSRHQGQNRTGRAGARTLFSPWSDGRSMPLARHLALRTPIGPEGCPDDPKRSGRVSSIGIRDSGHRPSIGCFSDELRASQRATGCGSSVAGQLRGSGVRIPSAPPQENSRAPEGQGRLAGSASLRQLRLVDERVERADPELTGWCCIDPLNRSNTLPSRSPSDSTTRASPLGWDRRGRAGHRARRDHGRLLQRTNSSTARVRCATSTTSTSAP